METSRTLRPALRHVRIRALVAALLAAVLLTLTSGCIGMWSNTQRHEASSVVQFLYPDKSQPFIEPQIPTLQLPLRVGVAFIPPYTPDGRGQHYRSNAVFSESQKAELLRGVSAQFRALPFVQSIETIPTTYLRPGGGFENLDQLRALMGIDVVVLIAYDQVQNSSDTEASLAYWTIVGAYIVPAQRNSTSTLMEAVVYDIPSRSLLFRAPGTSTVQGHSTLIRTDEDLRADSARSLNEAAVQMTANLQSELGSFKVRIRENPTSVRIEHKPGYTGGGALDIAFVLALGLLFAVRRLRVRR